MLKLDKIKLDSISIVSDGKLLQNSFKRDILINTKVKIGKFDYDTFSISKILFNNKVKHNNKIDSIKYDVSFVYNGLNPLMNGILINDSLIRLDNILKLKSDYLSINKLINLDSSLVGNFKIKDSLSILAKVRDLSNIKTHFYNNINFISNNTKNSIVRLQDVDLNIPVAQEIALNDSILNIKESKNRLSNLSKIKSIDIFINRDTIKLNQCRFNFAVSGLNFRVDDFTGYTTGGNFKTIFRIINSNPEISINIKSPIKKLINFKQLMENYKIQAGVDAKRINVKPSRAILNKNLVNMNAWLELSNFNINNFRSVLINSNIDFNNIGYNAALVILDKLYNQTRNRNLIYLKYAIKMGYGMDKMSMNIDNSNLSVVSYLRSDNRNILPLFIRIRPKRYEIISNLYINDLIYPMLKEVVK